MTSDARTDEGEANPHFMAVASWEEAERELAFTPAVPADTGGRELTSLAIFVRDHRMRELPVEDRVLEAHLGEAGRDAFVFTQARHGTGRAREAALSTPYGADPRAVEVQGHEGRGYERGPEPAPDDLDPAMPAVVVWHAGEMFYLLASGTLAVDELLQIARSVS